MTLLVPNWNFQFALESDSHCDYPKFQVVASGQVPLVSQGVIDLSGNGVYQALGPLPRCPPEFRSLTCILSAT